MAENVIFSQNAKKCFFLQKRQKNVIFSEKMAENVIFSQNDKKCFFPPKKAKNVKHYVKCENIEIRPLVITYHFFHCISS